MTRASPRKLPSARHRSPRGGLGRWGKIAGFAATILLLGVGGSAAVELSGAANGERAAAIGAGARCADRRVASTIAGRTISSAARTPAPSPDASPAQRVAQPPEPAPADAPRPRSSNESCSRSGEMTICTSSVLATSHGISYGPGNLTDGDDATAWVEGSSGQGAGEFVVLEFDAARAVRGLTIKNGYDKSPDIYAKNSRVKDIELRFSTGDRMQATLKDAPGRASGRVEPAGRRQMGRAHHPLGLSRLEIFRHRHQRARRGCGVGGVHPRPLRLSRAC